MSKRRVVVTGLGTIAPVGNSTAAAWDNVVNGRSGIAPIAGFDVSAFSTRFGGDDFFTLSLGAGYRFIANDWLAIHLDARNHMFDSDLLGEMQNKQNLELTGGLTIFF